MKKQLRIAAIHDISCLGRCSLTVALPILSAVGIEVGLLPTAILSTQTGGANNDYTFMEITDNLESVISHFKKLNMTFDCIYTGFLGSKRQISIVADFISHFTNKDTIVMVDPVMGDEGEFYGDFSNEIINGMKDLLKEAHIIIPNMTEALFLLGKPYKSGPYTKDFIEEIINELQAFNLQGIVLTGVYFNQNQIGAAVWQNGNEISYIFNKKAEGLFHGTGDVFASAVLGAYLNGKTLNDSTRIASKFTESAILKTIELNQQRRFGVCFELFLKDYVEMVYE